MPRRGGLFSSAELRSSRWRLKPERLPLVWPSHRKIDEAFETVATRQASLNRGLDDVRGEECERQGHPHRTVGLALSHGEQL
jgi:hypothetical protein